MKDPIIRIIEILGYFILATATFIFRYIISGSNKLQDTLLLALGLTFFFISIIEVIKLANGDDE